MHLRSTISTLIALFCLTIPTQAINVIATNLFEVTTNSTLETEHWIFAGQAEIYGTVQDDLFIASGDLLNLEGTYKGDVWGAGSLASLKGTALRNVRLMGSLAQLDAHVAGNFMALGYTVKVNPTSHIEGDVSAYGATSIILEGLIDGNVNLVGNGSVTLSADIGGDVTLRAPEIVIQPNTRIKGDLHYTSPKELVLPEGIVSGKTKRILAKAPALDLAATLRWFLGAVLTGIPFIALFPITIAVATQTLRKSAFLSMGIGALASVFMLSIGFSLMVSRATLPPALMLLSGVGILGYAGKLLSALVLGSLILRPKTPTLAWMTLSMVLGLLIIYLGLAFPPTHDVIYLSTTWLGMGALLLSAIRKRRMIIQLPKDVQTLEDLRKLQNNNKKEEQP